MGPTLQQYTHWRNNLTSVNLRLYVVGWIDYADEMGTTRRTGFLRRYNQGKSQFVDRFIPLTDPDYEYAD